ncbi:hypothetical protein DZA65_03215 [Dickeya dianthicola]|nr:hypothetical protein [Dickeya dianthicola]AYC20090.1 hypothetical protein DZA65_03215 [Dickeya dianthicola]QVH37173.1 hypothetical protein JRZ93_16165 [Dickeya dianthicola]QVH41371.1 hypothetical protein JRZ83_16175 [Dickeya dianthicola]QVH45571.1 hypothetical protein JRZ88_16180 [Dickeya dianthicola]QVH49771.1 hypothetical protein JRZ86_16175 [Dickeya dianthicola]
MSWRFINGWYCITACGLVSGKFLTLHEGIEWAFTAKAARNAAENMGV